MRAGAHRHPVAVEDGAYVVRVRPLDIEGDDAPLPGRAAVNGEPVERSQALHCIIGQLLLMRLDPFAADALDIIDGGAEPDRLHDGRRPRLELYAAGWHR